VSRGSRMPIGVAPPACSRRYGIPWRETSFSGARVLFPVVIVTVARRPLGAAGAVYAGVQRRPVKTPEGAARTGALPRIVPRALGCQKADRSAPAARARGWAMGMVSLGRRLISRVNLSPGIAAKGRADRGDEPSEPGRCDVGPACSECPTHHYHPRRCNSVPTATTRHLKVIKFSAGT